MLKVDDVYKVFPAPTGPVEVLRGVGFEVSPRGTLAVIGPSGSGKSTLLHLIGTLDQPTRGRIELDGSELHTMKERQLAEFRNRRVGFVFQDHHLLPQYSVLENVLVPTFAGAADRSGATENARMLLDRVGLSHRLGHRPAELSGGEKQRTAVARALINRPALLLCDEPTGSLDASTADNVAALLFELQREQGNILITVTHSTELARRFERRLELREGRCFEA